VRRSVCSIALFLVCLEWKPNSYDYRTPAAFDLIVATLPSERLASYEHQLLLFADRAASGLIFTKVFVEIPRFWASHNIATHHRKEFDRVCSDSPDCYCRLRFFTSHHRAVAGPPGRHRLHRLCQPPIPRRPLLRSRRFPWLWPDLRPSTFPNR
jgi:hypothetical protein